MPHRETIEEDLAVWRAERAIGRIVQDYARGIDRRDFDSVRNCFHAGAWIEYGDWFEGDVDAAISWLEGSIPRLSGTLHVFGPPLIDLDLEHAAAFCDVYAVNSALYPPDAEGVVIQNVSGTRYVDRFECRDGIWAIVTRRNRRVWTMNQPVGEDPSMPG